MTHDLSTSTAAEDLEHKDMDAALCQNSRRRLVSVDEFQYLNVPHIELIMVYDDFECIFKCLYHPSCISFNLAAEGKLWCEQAHGSSYYYKTFESGGVCGQSMYSVYAFKFFCEEDLEGKFSEKESSPQKWWNEDAHVTLFFQNHSNSGQCRSLVFKPAKAFDGQRLRNHVIRVSDVKEKDFCGILCYMEPYCVSYNLGKQPRAADGRYTCELNNATHEGNKDDLVEDQSYIFGGAESACITNPCKNNAKCQSGFTDKGYRCMCSAGYKGLTCDEDIDECATREHNCSVDGVCGNVEGSYNCGCKPGYSGDGRTCKDIDECASGTHNCSADAVCNNTKGSFNCSCKSGYFGDGRTCKGEFATISSCKEAYDRKILSGSGVVTLHIGSKPTSVFCQVGNVECGNGTWTLVMKTDGSKRTFHYDSHYWSNRKEYNPPGGETGFDQMETKLPTYWSTSFSKICLGMKIDQQLRFIVINKKADSLYSLIADGQYRPTSLGRDTWRSLIGPKASTQIYCNREGFNLYPLTDYWEFGAAKARIGFLTNNANNCDDVDTRIGFGTGGPHDDNNTCGIVADKSGLDNGRKFIKAMGYILVH
nr:uncharacterized protein LOC131792381 [Pocillopora verrucosa]